MRLRIATFNIENLDDVEGQKPTLTERISVLRPQLQRLRADIICFQEVNGQDRGNQDRDILALKQLLQTTHYANFNISCTKTSTGEVLKQQNLVVVSRFDILESLQYLNDLVPAPKYDTVTEIPPKDQAKKIAWERPIFYTRIKVQDDFVLHLINVHLKSRLPIEIPGQKKDEYTWKSAAGWAEGFFLASLKRVGQSLETRVLIDKIFDNEPGAKIVVCGDFNAHPEEVPVEAITGRVENTGNKDLISRVLAPCEHTIPESSRYSYIHQGSKRLLDHMLISQGMLSYYRAAEIHNEVLHDESVAFAVDEKFPESDHAPFIVEFEI